MRPGVQTRFGYYGFVDPSYYLERETTRAAGIGSSRGAETSRGVNQFRNGQVFVVGNAARRARS